MRFKFSFYGKGKKDKGRDNERREEQEKTRELNGLLKEIRSEYSRAGERGVEKLLRARGIISDELPDEAKKMYIDWLISASRWARDEMLSQSMDGGR